MFFFFFSSRRRHTRCSRDWSSDVCSSDLDRWWMLLIQGVISIAFGVFAIVQPGLSIAYIVVSVALWMLFAGTAQLLLARGIKTMGGSPRWAIVGGILTLVLAIAAVAFPRGTVAAVLVFIAWVALVIGIVQLVVAFRIRSLLRAAVAVWAVPTPTPPPAGGPGPS